MPINDPRKDSIRQEKKKLAKIKLKSVAKEVEKNLNHFFLHKSNHFFSASEYQKKYNDFLWDHIKDHCTRPAKRLRGTFVYYGYKLLKEPDKNNIFYATSAVEIIHTALLMHDDFMDQDDARRGADTTQIYFSKYHKKNKFTGDAGHYGDSMAVDVGDIALLSGFQLMLNSGFDHELSKKALNRLFDGILDTGFGQAQDITLEAKKSVDMQEIINMYKAKTAIYTYQTPLQVGAILAGAKQKDLKLITSYALAAGVAFQIQDDIIGIFGQSDKTGKSDYSDIRQGKATILYTKAVQKAGEKDKKTLEKLWGKQDIAKDEVEKVREIIANSGSLDYSKNLSESLTLDAVKSLNKMRGKFQDEALDFLEGIAFLMIDRNV